MMIKKIDPVGRDGKSDKTDKSTSYKSPINQSAGYLWRSQDSCYNDAMRQRIGRSVVKRLTKDEQRLLDLEDKVIAKSDSSTLILKEFSDPTRVFGEPENRLMDYIMWKYSESHWNNKWKEGNYVVFNRDTFIRDTGKPVTKNSRKSVLTSVNNLSKTQIQGITKEKGKREAVAVINILEGYKCEKGANAKVHVYLSPLFIKHMIAHGNLAPFPKLLLKVDAKKFPYAYTMGNKLCLSAYLNRNSGKDEDGYHLISVKALCKNIGLPSKEEIRKGDRDYAGRIARPLLRDLEALGSDKTGSIDILTFELTKARRAPLSEEELKKAGPSKSNLFFDIDFFLDELYIKFKLKNYPVFDEPKRADKKKLSNGE